MFTKNYKNYILCFCLMSSLTFAPGDGDANLHVNQEHPDDAPEQRFKVEYFIAIMLKYMRTVGGDTYDTLLKLIDAPSTAQEIKVKAKHGTFTSGTDLASIGVMVSPSFIAATSFNQDPGTGTVTAVVPEDEVAIAFDNLITQMQSNGIDPKGFHFVEYAELKKQGSSQRFDLNSLSTFIDALLHAEPHHGFPEGFDLDLAQKAIHTACILLLCHKYDKEFTAHGPDNEHKIIQELCNNIARRVSNI